MDWTYGKYVRRPDLKKMIEKYRKETSHIACCFNTGHSSELGEVKIMEHPNTSAEV